MYGFEPKGIHIRDEEEVASPAAEEWLDRMTAVHNQIFATLHDVNNYNAGPFDRRKIRLKALCRRGIEHVTSRA